MLRCHDVVSRFEKFQYNPSSGNFFFYQKSSYMLLMISLFLSPSSLPFAPTLLQTVKEILFLSSISKQLSTYVVGF